MECIVDVIRYRTFTTKKGNHAGEAWVCEKDGIPYKILVWDPDQARKPLPDSRQAKLYTDVDFNMNGTLKLKW